MNYRTFDSFKTPSEPLQDVVISQNESGNILVDRDFSFYQDLDSNSFNLQSQIASGSLTPAASNPRSKTALVDEANAIGLTLQNPNK